MKGEEALAERVKLAKNGILEFATRINGLIQF
jgi:hypothetical protein